MPKLAKDIRCEGMQKKFKTSNIFFSQADYHV